MGATFCLNVFVLIQMLVLTGMLSVSPAPQFERCTVKCFSRDSISHLLTHPVVYIIALCSSLNTTTFCLLDVCPVRPHPTDGIAILEAGGSDLVTGFAVVRTRDGTHSWDSALFFGRVCF
jgi:hypothetical protein